MELPLPLSPSPKFVVTFLAWAKGIGRGEMGIAVLSQQVRRYLFALFVCFSHW